MQTLFFILRNSVIQFGALFGVFLVGGAVLTYLSRSTNNVFRQFIFPRFGLYAFGMIGIPVHEFSHALFCKLFLHDLKKVKWFDAKAKGGAHGSVEHQFNPWNIYHRIGHFFIGLGPAILAPLLLALLFYALVPGAREAAHFNFTMDTHIPAQIAHLLRSMLNRTTLSSPGFYIFLYLGICISSQIELSHEDLKQVAIGVVPILLVLVLLNLFSWASGASLHLRIMSVAARMTPAVGCVFVFSATLAAINLAICTVLFGVVNMLSGRDGVNPFRSQAE